MNIQLTLNKSLIKEAVKSETFLRGGYVRAAGQDASSVGVANKIQAGDEEVDERKIERDIRYATEKLKTIFVDYITPSPIQKGDDMVDSKDDENNIIFHLTVSRRWNGTLTDACARLSSRFIQDCAIQMWYLALGDKQAEYYTALVKQDEVEVRKCFIKSPPEAPNPKYSTNIELTEPALKDGAITITNGEAKDGELSADKPIKFTYKLDDGAIDDIETHSSAPDIVKTYVDNEGNWCIKPVRTGEATITFFSRHHDEVRTECKVVVQMKEKNQHIDPHVDPLFPHHPYR